MTELSPNPEERLSQALGSLPRERASAGFTEGVLERTRRRGWLAAPRPWPQLAAVAAVVALAVLGVAQWQEERGHTQAQARLAALEAEHHELEMELRELRQIAERARPVIYLEGDEADRVDLVLDLGRLARRNAGDIRPASFNNDNPGDL